MKKIFLTFSVCILAVISLQAQKCKYDYDKKDEITGVVTRSIQVRQTAKACSLIQTGDSFTFNVNVNTTGNRSEIVKVGDTLIVKLENEKIIYLFSKEQVLPVAQTSTIYDPKGNRQGPVYTNYSINYPLPKELLKELKESPIKLCRVVFSGLNIDLDYKDKSMVRIQKGAICMDGSN